MKDEVDLEIPIRNIKTEPQFVQSEVGSTYEINNFNEISEYEKLEKNLETVKGNVKSETDNPDNNFPDKINLDHVLQFMKKEKDVEDYVVDCKIINKDTYGENLVEKLDPYLDQKLVLEEAPLMVKSESENQVECEWRTPNQSNNQQNGEDSSQFSGIPINEQLYNAKLFESSKCNYRTNQKSNRDLKLFKNSVSVIQTKDKTNLKRHLQTVQNPDCESSKCPHCGLQTKNKRNLKRHMHLLHDSDRESFECSQCDFQTSCEYYLERHVRNVHKPYFFKCLHCDLQTVDISYLKQHIKLLHSAIPESFQCPHCDFKTTCKGYLRRHVRNIHNRHLFKCLHCGLQIKQSELERHIQLHNPVARLFKCLHCGLQTKDRSNLRRHIFLLHNSEPESSECSQSDFQTKYMSYLKQNEYRSS